ncbi:MAG: tetratricopeptide repeat protein, partial [Anaerolineales bacterium]|nr:tetratricopeptide repeat protein [Anaerolineales bacterium]
LTRAIELDGALIGAYWQRAQVYADLGELDAQIADLGKVVALEPKNVTAYKTRAAALLAQQKFDLALADYAQLLQLEPKTLTHYADRARVYQAAGRLDQAIADYSTIIALDAKNADAFYRRGWVYGSQNQRAKALDDFTSAIRLNAQYATQPLLDPIDAQFEFGDDIARDHRQTIRNFILLAQHYLGSQFPLQVNAFTTTAALKKSDAWLNVTQLTEMDQGKVAALAGHKNIAVLMSTRYLNAGLENRFGLIAHEYFHLWQDKLSGMTGVPNSRAVPDQGPLWLIEGCAEHLEDRVLEFYGMRLPKNFPYVPLAASLAAMESKAGSSETYESGQYYLGYYACGNLEQKAGKDAVFQKYWETVGQGNTWETSFQIAFGISREAFYSEFENIRRLTPTPTRAPTRTPTPRATATPRP